MEELDFSSGIESISFQVASTSGATAGEFPSFAEGVTTRNFKYIQIDSVTEEKDDDTVEDIMVEEMDDPIKQITTEKGRKKFALVTYDLTSDSLKYWLGDKLITEEASKNKDWYVGDTEYVLPLQAMQIIDKKMAGSEQRIWQYMPVNVLAKVSGTRGKSGLLTLTLSGTLMGNKDKDGNKLPNYRWKPVGEAAAPAMMSSKKAPVL